MEKKKVLLFGAGDGGARVSYLLEREFEVVAFIDNDTSKQGKTLLSKPILAPNEIIKYNYDYIVISTIHGTNVSKQLIEELHVGSNKIIDYYKNNMFDTRIATMRLIADEIYENNIPGNVAELGVFKGEFSQYINESFHDRYLYLFDTFEGFNIKDISVEKVNGFSDSRIGEFCNKDERLVLNKMKYPDHCIIKKGYFPESASDVDDTFVFVSLDVDLYNPIYEGLKFFYPKMSKGGYIMIHDYNSTRFHGVKKAVRAFCSECDAKFIPISDLCGSIVIIK